METLFQHITSNLRYYRGISLSIDETKTLLAKQVKDKLLDTPQKNEFLDYLNSLKKDTGFETSETLLVDIQTLENPQIEEQDFRIGEAFAEVVLEKHFSCRFYWNELRDTRNPKANKTGADLVGFIEVDNDILFLFGEVKTSSEQQSPPQVMTNSTGIENQLRDLYNDKQKRLLLIAYIQSKIGLIDNSNFKQDFDAAIKNYYKQNSSNYLLYGVLIRDTVSNENDVKKSFEKLNNEFLNPCGLKLLAVYLPIPKKEWLSIIKGESNESD